MEDVSMPMTVAYPGEEGAYAAEAGARLYPEAELVSLRSWADVVRAVGRGDAGYGVLPIENSLAGPIPETYDLLAHAPLAIVAETVIPVPHCLVGLPGANIDALARVHSHPAALAQCRRFLSSLPDTLPEVAPSTAAAARRVAEAGDARQAALSSRRAAERFGLVVLLNDVSDHAENYTRFVSVANHTRIDRDGVGVWHTAVRFVTHHHPGALLSAIEPLARYGVNMVSLQSRPIPGRPWNYQFYADLEGHPMDAAVATALRELERNVADMGYLGCYPAFDRD
jgi:prephenate dehydratase